jgi:glutamate-1-semialdehyde 2,1-aminomutase
MRSAKGAYLFDEDGNRYIDYINSWGPMIMGHGFEPVLQAIGAKLSQAVSFGAPTELEIEMAETIVAMAPNVDMVRMVNSGTEACMSAVRLARGFTGRNKIIKFEGCYHGHADSFLVKAGSGVATLKIDRVPGVTPGVAADSFIAPYNHLSAVENIIAQHRDEIAAIIIEPVAGNMGCILPEKGFLEGLRAICDKEGIVLIFDEVMTGFRLAPGGAQERLGISADLVTYGKVIGGGLPVGAFGGKKEIMEHIAPIGKVYQAGTLSGNPLAMAAGHSLLNYLRSHPSVYQELEEKTAYLHHKMQQIFGSKQIPVVINRCGSMISIHFSSLSVNNFSSAAGANNNIFNRLFHHMLHHGIYLPPSAFETWFISNAVSKEDLDATLDAISTFNVNE